MKCGCRCENAKLQMGHYNLKKHTFAIDIVGCGIVLGAKWLPILGPITIYFKVLYMIFLKESHIHTLKGLYAGPLEFIGSHRIEKLLKKGHSSIIDQLHVIQELDNMPLEIPLYLQ